MTRLNISTGSPWERKYGYSRAVRIDPHIWVSGTIAADGEGNLLGKGDPYAQTVHAFRKIERALKEAGVSLQDIVYMRFYVTDMRHADEIGRALSETLPGVNPCCTMVQAAGLALRDALVEVEAHAIVPDFS